MTSQSHRESFAAGERFLKLRKVKGGGKKRWGTKNISHVKVRFRLCSKPATLTLIIIGFVHRFYSRVSC